MVRRRAFDRGRARRSWLLVVAGLALLLIPVGVLEAKPKQEKKQPKAAKIVVPPQTETIRFPFREDRDDKTRTFTLEARPHVKPETDLLFDYGDLLTDEGDAFPKGQITVTAARSSLGNVEVTVTLNPDGDVDVEPGEYTGTLSVAGKRIEPGAVTLTATLRDSKEKAIIWALLGFFIGLLVKIAGDFSRMRPGPIEQKAAADMLAAQNGAAAQKSGADDEPAPAGLELAAAGKRTFEAGDYFGSASFFSSLLLGLLGAGTAYALAYLSNDTWGADSLDNWKVAASAFAGVITGASGADLIKPFRPTATTEP